MRRRHAFGLFALTIAACSSAEKTDCGELGRADGDFCIYEGMQRPPCPVGMVVLVATPRGQVCGAPGAAPPQSTCEAVDSPDCTNRGGAGTQCREDLQCITAICDKYCCAEECDACSDCNVIGACARAFRTPDVFQPATENAAGGRVCIPAPGATNAPSLAAGCDELSITLAPAEVSGDPIPTLDGAPVASCVRLDFDGDEMTAELLVLARTTSNSCNVAADCDAPCEAGGDCEPRSLLVFASADGIEYHQLPRLRIGPGWERHLTPVGAQLHIAMLCLDRLETTAASSVVIDAVTARRCS